MSKLSYGALGLALAAFNTQAVEVSYRTFKLTEDYFGVYADVKLNAEEKTANASIVFNSELKCGKHLAQLNQHNSFAVKKYLVFNQAQMKLDLESNSKLFWLIKSDDIECLKQAAVNIDLQVDKYQLEMAPRTTKPPKIEDINIKDLEITKLKFPVTLADSKIAKQPTGVSYWGEVDHFSQYGRLFFELVWDTRAGDNPYHTISNYQLECLTQDQKLVSDHQFLFKPTLLDMPSAPNQSTKLLPFIFTQGKNKEYFSKCTAHIEYQHQGSSYHIQGVWLHEAVN